MPEHMDSIGPQCSTCGQLTTATDRLAKAEAVLVLIGKAWDDDRDARADYAEAVMQVLGARARTTELPQ